MNKQKIVDQCRREYEAGVRFKQGRVKDWQATEDLYYGRVLKTTKSRSNIPMPVMSGFVDTLMSKIDDAPIIKFKPTEESDFIPTQKLQAFYDSTIHNEDNDFESKDLDAKKMAIFSGRAIFKVYGESDPKFKFCINVVDHYDFYVDPTGGGNLEDARFLGQDNIFKSKSQLIQGANNGYYDKKNVLLIVNGLAEQTVKENDDLQRNKANRMAALGLSQSMYNFMGEGTQRFIESGTIYEGERYYVLWEYGTNLAIRCVPLKEVFKSELWWFTSWATHRDMYNFWSKAPADDIRPVAETIKILANQEIDNRYKRNFGQRAYDPEMFPNGAELEYRPNGLVAVRAGSSKIQAIASGIYEFQTPELNGTIDLVNWLDNFSGQKSGVTAAAQGTSEEDKVGIYEGNMQQVADRLNSFNKSYTKCHAAIGRRFVWACYEHLNEKQAVKLIGENGVQWDTIRKEEVNPDVDIIIESGAQDVQLNAAKKNRRALALTQINQNPALVGSVNKKWMLEQILLNGEYSDEDIRVALDVDNNGDRIVMAKASEAIEEIIEGKQPKLFRGATTGFQQKIVDFALDNTDDDLDLYMRLMSYSDAHNDIVMENMSRKAMKARTQQGMGLPQEMGEGIPVAGGASPTMTQEMAGVSPSDEGAMM